MEDDLLFPNESKKKEMEQIKKELTPEEIDNQKLRERVELLREEKELEEAKKQRVEKKKRRLTKGVVKREMKKRQALAMRMRNMPIDEIAAKLEISPYTAAKLIREGIAELPEETNVDMKKLLTRTLVKLLGNFEKIALTGGVKEADIVLKSILQLMKITGLNIQRQEIDQINMDAGKADGIDVAELDLDLDTKRKLLEAIRKKVEKENPSPPPVDEDEEENNEDK